MCVRARWCVCVCVCVRARSLVRAVESVTRLKFSNTLAHLSEIIKSCLCVQAGS